jgi:hypothetical protein
MLRRVATWTVIIFVVYYVTTQPIGAGHFAHSVLNDLKAAGHSLTIFFSSI